MQDTKVTIEEKINNILIQFEIGVEDAWANYGEETGLPPHLVIPGERAKAVKDLMKLFK